ncbi:hypothetical protein ACWDA9_15740 [Streptomyces sp. NPDC001193]
MATLAPPARIPLPSRATAWDHAAILALGAAGCALSYDALQQMAVAIHVRGFLTYLFPLLIDGFIAYGVRALIILRGAPSAPACTYGPSSAPPPPPAPGPTLFTRCASTSSPLQALCG